MGTYLKPKTAGLTRLNTKEYLNVMQRVLALLTVEEIITKLGVADILKAMRALMVQLEDLVNRTMANIETQEMAETDFERDGYISYLFSIVRAAKKAPLATHREAYRRLKLALSAYKNLARMRNMEETVAIGGMLVDLAKADVAADVVTLNLTDTLTAIKTANDRYAALTDARAAARIAAHIETAKTIRTEMDSLYDDLTTRIMAVNIITPAEEAESFLIHQNQIVDEAMNAFALRYNPPTNNGGNDPNAGNDL